MSSRADRAVSSTTAARPSASGAAAWLHREGIEHACARRRPARSARRSRSSPCAGRRAAARAGARRARWPGSRARRVCRPRAAASAPCSAIACAAYSIAHAAPAGRCAAQRMVRRRDGWWRRTRSARVPRRHAVEQAHAAACGISAAMPAWSSVAVMRAGAHGRRRSAGAAAAGSRARRARAVPRAPSPPAAAARGRRDLRCAALRAPGRRSGVGAPLRGSRPARSRGCRAALARRPGASSSADAEVRRAAAAPRAAARGRASSLATSSTGAPSSATLRQRFQQAGAEAAVERAQAGRGGRLADRDVPVAGGGVVHRVVKRVGETSRRRRCASVSHSSWQLTPSPPTR